MVPEFIIITRAGLNQIIRSLHRLNANYELGLCLYKELPSAAVWVVSNCIITAIELESSITKLELQTPGLAPPSDKAGRSWNQIGQLFSEIGWVAGFAPILIDDQSAFLDRFFKLVKLAETPEPNEAEDAGVGLEKEREQAKIYLHEHERVINMTTEERAALWIESFGIGGTPVLSELERGIIAVYRELREERLAISDQRITTRLAVDKGIRNEQGEAYSRRWVCEVRNRLIEMGYDLKV